MSLVSSHVQQSARSSYTLLPCRVSDLTRYCCRLEILDLFSLTSSAGSPIICKNIIFPREFTILWKNRIRFFFCLFDYKNEHLHFAARRIASLDRNISKIISRDSISQLQSTVTTRRQCFAYNNTILSTLRCECYFITRSCIVSQEWLRNTWCHDLTIILTRIKLDDNNSHSCMRMEHDEYRYSRIFRGIRDRYEGLLNSKAEIRSNKNVASQHTKE